MKKILHLLTGGNPGGIEVLCRELSKSNLFENGFAFMSFGGQVFNQMQKAGSKVYPLFNLGGKISITKAKELIKISRDYDCLIIHHEDPFLAMYYCYLIKKTKIKGIRYVHSCYDDDWQRYSNPLKENIKKYITQKTFDISDKVVFVSKAGLESCKRLYSIEKKKECIVYNGVSNMLLKKGLNRIEKGKGISKDRRELLYIGRLTDIKGVDRLIKSVPSIIKKFHVHLTIVGDGDEYSRLKQMVEELKIEQFVSFEGFQVEIAEYLDNADYFVYPSTCKEVFGLSLVEAMAFGIPCITNKVGGITEIVTDGKNGFLTENLTIEALEYALKKALTVEDSIYEMMVKNARRTAEYFSMDNCEKHLLEVLEQIGCKE